MRDSRHVTLPVVVKADGPTRDAMVVFCVKEMTENILNGIAPYLKSNEMTIYVTIDVQEGGER